jgi:hypothetical protein
MKASLMKTLTILSLTMFLLPAALAQDRITIYLEDGTIIRSVQYKIGQGDIMADGISYSSEEILFFLKAGKVNVFEFESQRKLEFKKRITVDPENVSDLAIPFAAKYYKYGNPSQISSAFRELSRDPAFMQNYDTWVKKMKNQGVLSAIGVGCSILGLLIVLLA